MLRLLAILSSLLCGGDGLEEVISDYWTNLCRGNKAAAAQFVLAESQRDFFARREPVVRSWKVLDIRQFEGNDRAEVTVLTERLLGDGFYPWKVHQEWLLDHGRWRVLVRDGAPDWKRLWQTQRRRVTPGIVEVLPFAIKIHWLSSRQEGTAVILNGLDAPVEVRVERLDESRFELIEAGGRIGSNSYGRIRFRYRGNESGKELRSRLGLSLTSPSGVRTISIPILFNHLSPAARSLLGIEGSSGPDGRPQGFFGLSVSRKGQ